MPAIGPYCKACRSASGLRDIESSFEGSSGERVVKFRDVMGNVAELGYPARKEITPGFFSSGMILRTRSIGQTFTEIWSRTYLDQERGLSRQSIGSSRRIRKEVRQQTSWSVEVLAR